ncbi:MULTISPECIES: diaminopimelate epimerase [unclassified Butyrivibrio]|uniref:diaminopimelate epimerase n=1 Tax=unclassified Butyrivibrio TaxID=2639466 RepID=UPI0003F4CE11|nr:MULTISPECIES: diaminopimelate epimerase [unclassified Butyrivibrio]
MHFTKMHGCGNDYIYVDGSKEKIAKEDKSDLVRLLSDRHFGVGGDGVIFINKFEDDLADFEMEMYNADGSYSEMCGNGIRCVAKYVYDKGLTDKKKLRIVSGGRVRILDLKTEDDIVTSVRVNMGAPILTPAEIPVSLPDERAMAAKQVINYPIKVMDREYSVTCVSMGNPHAVVFLNRGVDIDALDLEKIGPRFEHHSFFPKGINTEFVTIDDRENVHMRVWERGTGETLACGTGCCATVVACVLNDHTSDNITVHVRGGEIKCKWDREENVVYMTGPATTVFEGDV